MCPENVYGAYLCSQHAIPFMGGDAPNSLFLPAIIEKDLAEKDLVFFMLALNFPIWNRDQILTNANIKLLVSDMINNNIPYWLNKPVQQYSFEEFVMWHIEHIGKPFDIRDFSWGRESKEFMPVFNETATIYQKIQSIIMPIRDMQYLKTIQNTLTKYDTVLIVFGASHYEWQKKALIKLFGEPKVTKINCD